MPKKEIVHSRSGFSVVKITELDEAGNPIGVSYIIIDPNHNIIERGLSYEEAMGRLEDLIKDLKPSGPSMGM